MKVVKYYKFGNPDVLQIEETSKVEPKRNEIQIKVHASTVNSGDCHMRSGTPFLARVFAGPIRPKEKVLGTTVAGKVIKIGSDVSRFKVGDDVFASFGIKSGAHSEYVNLSEEATVAIIPRNINYNEAASLVFGSLSAKYFLDKAGISQGKKVLIIGASGGVGSYAVQLAHYNKANVTGVCHTQRSDYVLSLGADQIIDYKKTDLSKISNTYDIILDTVGNTPVKVIQNLLSIKGVYVTTVAKLSIILKGLSKKDGKRYSFDVNKSNASDLEYVANLVESGKYKALIDQVYPINDVISAHEHVEHKRKQGAVVLSFVLN